MRRLIFGLITVLLLGIEVLIALFAHGWVRIYLGDVLVVILLYTIVRTVIPNKQILWFIIPSVILVFAFAVEFLQLWGFCDRFGITNEVLRIIIGTGFSLTDLACYLIGILPCYLTEFLITKRKKQV
ncbi:MAG: DUF2809 domain-containing protein [Clostridiales bacterium]|nr:DUF2809 domain-containing protein [Clostridiales bacterium]